MWLLLISWLALADPTALGAWAAQQPNPDPAPAKTADYRFTGALFSEIDAATRDLPGVVKPEVIGRSLDGRPIWAFHITDPATPVRRKVLVFAGIHALEWISTECATATLLSLAKRPIPGVSVTVIPLLNPDGRAKTERDLITGKRAYRRGNLENVDLNRDFPVHRDSHAVWRGILPRYYATSPGPLSQPESRALDALVARERYDRAASLHAFGGFFYYPWTGRFRAPPDRAEFVELGRAMQQAMNGKAYKVRQLSHWGFFFRALGSEIDHLYATWGVRAFLIEITRSGIDPLRPATLRDYFRWYNPRQPQTHRDKLVRSLRSLASHEDLPSEAARRATGAPPAPVPQIPARRPRHGDDDRDPDAHDGP